MPSTLKSLDPTQVELEISITPEEYAAAQDAAFRKLVRNAKLPGFRPGKVPRKIFENAYGTATILERALDDLLNAKYPAALEEHGIEPLNRPSVEVVPAEEGAPPVFKAVVAIRPEFEPKDYTGVEIADIPEVADDSDVERALEQIRRDAAALVPVDRPAQSGDTVTIDYEGKVDGVAFEGGTAQGQETELLEDRFIPGFAGGIAGMKAGETKDVSAKFPDPYTKAELAGKDAVFTITVHEVKEPELPELDDELAKRVSRGLSRWTSCAPRSGAGSTRPSSATPAARCRPSCSRRSSPATISRSPRCWSSASWRHSPASRGSTLRGPASRGTTTSPRAGRPTPTCARASGPRPSAA